MNLRYLTGAIISIPLLPILYFQGRRIRSSIPDLPEAIGIDGKSIRSEYLRKPLNILAIGESTIAGVGVKTHQEGFTGTFANEISKALKCQVNWKVYAKSGYTAMDVQNNILPRIKEQNIDMIIIGLGANDTFKLNRPSKWKHEVKELIKTLKNTFPKAIIIFCNMPPIKDFPAFTPLIKFIMGNLIEVLGNELKKVVSEFQNVYYFGEKISLNSWTQKFNLNYKKEDFFSDGIHPSKLAYQIWAKDMANESLKHMLKNNTN